MNNINFKLSKIEGLDCIFDNSQTYNIYGRLKIILNYVKLALIMFVLDFNGAALEIYAELKL